jgi:phage-related minor tail protein
LEKTQEAIKIIKEEISKPINDSFLEKILDKFKDLTEITKTTTTVIAEEMVKAIDGVSQGIAESIVLGKNLKTSLKEVAQTILVDMIKAQLKEIGVLLAKLALEKSILFYKQAQASVSGGSGIFSSILGAFGGGGGTTAIDTSVISPFAEGGSVKGGEPITVGERGREVFMPKTDGTIIPSEKIGGVNNINFTIQSADVRGIKELLIDNRATITNIVNQALNARGRPALI